MNMGATSALQQILVKVRHANVFKQNCTKKAAAANSSQSTGVLTVNDNNEKVFTTGELVEKSTRVINHAPRKTRKRQQRIKIV